MKARKSTIVALALLVAASCAVKRAPPAALTEAPKEPRPPALASALETPPCLEGAVLPAGVLDAGGLVLLGEMHGVRELPAFAAEVVCHAAAGGREVWLGLEMPQSEQATLEAFLHSGGVPDAKGGIPFAGSWTALWQDGRSSEARLAMLQRLARLRAKNLPIHVFAFDVELDSYGLDRDRKMADALSRHLTAHPSATTLALVGNVHARTREGAPWDPKLMPMGAFLKAHHRVVSLDYAAPEGTAWMCDSAEGCGLHRLKSHRGEGKPGVELFAAPSPEGFDGLFRVASLTSSPPAMARYVPFAGAIINQMAKRKIAPPSSADVFPSSELWPQASPDSPDSRGAR